MTDKKNDNAEPEKFLGTGAVLHKVEDTMADFSDDIAAARAAQASAPAVIEPTDAVVTDNAPAPTQPDAGVPNQVPTPPPADA
jgi:hypothetical protein